MYCVLGAAWDSHLVLGPHKYFDERAVGNTWWVARGRQNSSDVKRGESFKRGGRPKGSKNRTKNI